MRASRRYDVFRRETIVARLFEEIDDRILLHSSFEVRHRDIRCESICDRTRFMKEPSSICMSAPRRGSERSYSGMLATYC
jgi:hypothetical protein